jgi:hypothetical protein
MADVKREVLEVVKGAKPWGVDVVDVRITRADYVEAITESVYRRMEAERKRVANELRSTGAPRARRSAPTPTASAKWRWPTPTATRRRSRARAMPRPPPPTPRPSAATAVRPVLPQPRGLQGELQQEERRDGARPDSTSSSAPSAAASGAAPAAPHRVSRVGLEPLWAALALMLVFEGCFPLLSPAAGGAPSSGC